MRRRVLVTIGAVWALVVVLLVLWTVAWPDEHRAYLSGRLIWTHYDVRRAVVWAIVVSVIAAAAVVLALVWTRPRKVTA